jgi:hypothetical protein
MGRHLTKLFSRRRERRQAKSKEQPLDDLEQRKDLLKRIAAGIAANKPPRW